MTRILAAALACRVQGSRLYGKPLQNLKPDYTILDHILTCMSATPEIEAIVLGISEGVANLPFIDAAKRHQVAYIVGSEKDVMWRLIQCGRAARATDVFRITSECPFTVWEMVADAWRQHVEGNHEITVVDFLPEGANFEIYRLDALERCHREGTDGDRSEYVSNYARNHQDRFDIAILKPAQNISRLDIRLTVDYPEDLVVCRRIFAALERLGPRIPMHKIVEQWDAEPELSHLVAPYSTPVPAWYAAPAVTAPAQKRGLS